MAQPERADRNMKISEFFNPLQDVVFPLPDPIPQGLVITIYGFIPPQANRFSVNLSRSKNFLDGDIALNADIRFDEGNIFVRNSYVNGQWGFEECGGPTLPLQKDAQFECTITVLDDKFKLSFNGQNFCEFSNRLPLDTVKYVIIRGDVQVSGVSFSLHVRPGVPPVAGSENSVNIVGNNSGNSGNSGNNSNNSNSIYISGNNSGNKGVREPGNLSN